jgi:hypothetical protein
LQSLVAETLGRAWIDGLSRGAISCELTREK